jgi:hypothetical protein
MRSRNLDYYPYCITGGTSLCKRKVTFAVGLFWYIGYQHVNLIHQSNLKWLCRVPERLTCMGETSVVQLGCRTVPSA